MPVIAQLTDAQLTALEHTALAIIQGAGLIVVAWLQLKARGKIKDVADKVQEVHVLANDRLTRIEAALERVTSERDNALAHIAGQEAARVATEVTNVETQRRIADGVARTPEPNG